MKIGLIGAGSIGAIHARAYRELGIEVAAVADLQEAAVKAKPEFANVRYYADYRQLLADPWIDAVDICVINRLHFEVIQAAVSAGKHIFCEKTMTDNIGHSTELLGLLRDYPKNFQVGYMKRFFPATQKAKELIDSAGEIFTTYIRSYQAFENHDPYSQDTWKPKGGQMSQIKHFASGGMLNMAGSHMLDVMHHLVGKARSVYATNWVPEIYDAELTSNALFKMENGSTVHFEAALSPYSRAGLRQDGWDEKIEINGKNGRLEIFYVIWDQPMNHAPMIRFYSQKEKIQTDYTFPKVNAFALELDSFLKDCMAGRKSVPGVKEGFAVDQVIDACYRSAASERAVELAGK